MQEKNHPVRLGRQHRELQTSLYFMVITNMLLGLTVVILSRKREITQFCWHQSDGNHKLNLVVTKTLLIGQLIYKKRASVITVIGEQT